MKSDYDIYPWILKQEWMPLPETVFWENILTSEIDWQRPIVKVFGREYLTPRRTAFVSENNISYSYSGTVHHGEGIPEWFLPLLEKVNLEVGIDFNGCLLNLYSNGKESMGWHSDNEPEIDAEKPIVSLSFGASRDFLFKNRFDGSIQSIYLSNGDLLIMYPGCQNKWLHSIPKRRKINTSRINLTFRCYLNN